MPQERRRLLALLSAVPLLFGYLSYRMVDLQVLDPDRYIELGDAQTIRTKVLTADRGRILDRDGNELAMSMPLRTVYTDPKFVVDAEATAEDLASLLGADAADLERKLGAENRFGYLDRHIDRDLGDRIDALGLPGVYVIDEPARFTPAGHLARAIVGSTDIDGKGLSGVEAQYDDVLTGTPGELTLERGPGGRTIPVGEHEVTPAVRGHDVQLTIDQPIQYEAERLLAEQVRAYSAKGGTAVVMSPKTGEILAMANVVNVEGEVVPSGNNAAVTTVFEPGSVMKLVTYSGAIDAGLVTPETPMSVPDTLPVSTHVYSEYHPHGLVTWPVAKCLVQSSNTCTIKLALALGERRMYEAFKAFGLGEPTGLGFPNELSGVVADVDDWSGTSIGSMPIGQGISVTPLQIVLAYNTIANGGTFVPPKLVSATISPDGEVHPSAAAPSRRVVSEATAATVRDMMRGVVLDGTGERAAVEGYGACGKTGTAVKPHNGGYTGPDGRRHYIATFIGLVDCADPSLSILVSIDDPQGYPYTGGYVAAPVFAELAQFALRQLDVPPAGAPPVAAPDPTAPPSTAPPSSTPIVVTDGPKVRAAAAGVTTTTVVTTG